MPSAFNRGVCLYCGVEGTVIAENEPASLIPDEPNTFGYRCRDRDECNRTRLRTIMEPAGRIYRDHLRTNAPSAVPDVPITDEQIDALRVAVGKLGVGLARPLNQLLTALCVNRRAAHAPPT